MEWLESRIVRRVLAVAIAVGVAIGIARVVSSARGDADGLRAPDAGDVAELAGVAPRADTTNLAALRPFAVAETMSAHSGRVDFRPLPRATAATLAGFIDAYGEAAL